MPADALIINADDLGLWPPVDAGIFEAWGQRAIGDSTVLANSPQLVEVLHTAREVAMPVGVHLNLTLGKPVSDPAEIPALVTPHGTFMKRQQWQLPLPVDQVRLELRRQVQRVLDLGCQPSHLDSHHHIHRYPEVFSVMVELARELGMPVRAVDDGMRTALRTEGIAAPDHFTMAFYGVQATVETLIGLVDACPGGILEIMSHPGFITPDVPSSYLDREQEFQALISPVWHDHLAKRRINIVGFSSL